MKEIALNAHFEIIMQLWKRLEKEMQEKSK